MKTVIGMKGLRAHALLAKGRLVLEMMSNHADFANPQPSLEEFRSSLAVLETCISEAANRDLVKVAARKAAEKRVKELLTLLANFVNIAARGDEAKIHGAGFSVRRHKTASAAVETPELVREVATSEPQTIALNWKPVPGAVSYIIQITTGDPSQELGWSEIGQSTGARFKTRVEQVLTNYWFRVRSFGTTGFSNWSDPVKVSTK